MKRCKRIDDKFANAKETDWIREGFTDDEVEKICNQAREAAKRERMLQFVKEQMIKYGFTSPDMTVTEFVEDVLITEIRFKTFLGE